MDRKLEIKCSRKFLHEGERRIGVPRLKARYGRLLGADFFRQLFLRYAFAHALVKYGVDKRKFELKIVIRPFEAGIAHELCPKLTPRPILNLGCSRNWRLPFFHTLIIYY